jgi:hypothetical protein
MAAETAGHIEKLHPGSEIIEGVSHPDPQCSYTNTKCKNCVKYCYLDRQHLKMYMPTKAKKRILCFISCIKFHAALI